MSCSIDEKILNICKYNYNDFLCKANVVGVGLSYKITKGITTTEKCIQVYVTKKCSINHLNPGDVIPLLYQGIKTDVFESGSFKSQSLTDRVRPITGGYSVGPNTLDQDGTMGCLVSDGTSIFMLSCNHVLAGENILPIGASILQPSLHDQGKFPQDAVALLYNFIPLNFATPTIAYINYVDAAIAEFLESDFASPSITFLGPPLGITFPQLNLNVQKVGKTSELTNGVIRTIGATLNYILPSGRTALFLDQILTSPMSLLGDSGSLLLDLNRNAIGLLNGGSFSCSSYSPISTVLNLLDVFLVTH